MKKAKSFLTVYEERITGVTKLHDEINPQDIIPTLHKGDDLILIPDKANKYDKTEIKVMTTTHYQIGWIPKECNIIHLKEDIFERLTNGITVLAKVSDVTGGTKRQAYLWLCNIHCKIFKKIRGIYYEYSYIPSQISCRH